MWEGGGYKYFLKLHITDFKRSLKKVMKSAVKHLNVFIISFVYWESFMRKVALVVHWTKVSQIALCFLKV